MDDDAPDELAAPVDPDSAAPAAPGIASDEPVGQTTEWFSVEDYLALDDEPALPRRQHHVTTVVVSHDGAVWLPAVLTTLAAQTRPPDAAVGVDPASSDASADLLEGSFGRERTVRLDGNPGFGEAVASGLAHLAGARVTLAARVGSRPGDRVGLAAPRRQRTRRRLPRARCSTPPTTTRARRSSDRRSSAGTTGGFCWRPASR